VPPSVADGLELPHPIEDSIKANARHPKSFEQLMTIPRPTDKPR